MTPSELLPLFRSEVADTVEPYLWSTDEFFVYADDAQKTFARLTDGIPDSSLVITTVAGQPVYDLDPRVLKVRAVYLADGRPVEVLNYEDLPSRGMRLDGRQGQPSALILGMDVDKVRIWPVPDSVVAVHLSVYRLPDDVTSDDEDTPFAIPAQHHLALIHWIKHRAYLKQDAETYDKAKAAECRAQFEAYCFQAQIEQGRARHKTRIVRYGGI
jgi:hypothetical protein